MTSIRILLLKLILLSMLTFILSACSSDNSVGPPPGNTPGSSNNSVFTISGSPIGTGSTPNSQLRKSIPITLDNSHTDFAIGSAYAVKNGAASTNFGWMVDVSNIGNETYCFIYLIGGRFLSDNGTQIGTDSNSVLAGNMRKILLNDSYTNTCLAPGESGYFVGWDDTISLEQIAGLVFDSIEAYTFESETTDLAMEADTYTATTPNDINQTVDLVVKNTGSTSVVVIDGSIYILLDDLGIPLMWDQFYLPTDGLGVLDSGQSETLQSTPYYEGTSTKLIVYLEVEAQATN